MENQKIIIFSSIDWNDNWQIHQKLASSLSSKNKVLFVENTGTRNPRISDYKRIFKRVRVWIKSIYGFRDIGKNLTLYSPIALPFPYIRLFQFINKFLIGHPIKHWLKISNFNNPIIINFIPTPIIISQIKKMNAKLIIYYCADNMSESTIIKEKLKKYENYFINESDLIITTALSLKERIIKLNNNVRLVPCGVDIKLFDVNKQTIIPKDIKEIKDFNKTIIGYVGAITDVIDMDLIKHLVNKYKNINFVFIGNIATNVKEIINLENVFFLGSKDKTVIPEYVKMFDIGIIPYKKNTYMDSVYPCKLNEYLAMGVHVISISIKEINMYSEEYPNVLEVANTKNEFEKKINYYLANKKELDKKFYLKRIQAASNNSWDKRYNDIKDSIIDSIDKKIKNFDKSWEEMISITYQKIFKSISRYILYVSIFLGITFYSPLFNIIGNYLIIQDNPKKSGAIVIFSGNGSDSYINQSYQLRALDGVNYYKEGYANKIFISSGREQSISEVEIISLYLESKGVKKDNIIILERYPDSTYQNVILVSKTLKENNIKKITLLTAPYHGLRSKLIWKKNAPDFDVHLPAVNDTPKNKYKFGITFKKLKIITYEYASIIYNWYLGRL